MDPKFLKLTKADEQIYGDFRKTFGDLKIDVLDPEELKSEPAKEVGALGGWNYGVGVLAPPQISPKSHPQKWRPFCLRFEGVVEDFNYGTLLRLDCSKGYTEENTIFGESQNLLIRLFLTPNPTRTPCRALRGGNGVGRGEAAPPRPAPSPPDLLRALFFFFFSQPPESSFLPSK